MGWLRSVLSRTQNRLRPAPSERTPHHNEADTLRHVMTSYLAQNPETGEEILQTSLKNDKIFVTVGVPSPQNEPSATLKQVGEESLKKLKEQKRAAERLSLLWIATRRGKAAAAVASPSLKSASPNSGGGGSTPHAHHPLPTGNPQPQQPAGKKPQKMSLPHIKSIIAVSAAKGGVGKSTTSVQLALALHKMGKRVGLLDADIYGPSIPHMLGLKDRAEIKDKVITPLEAYGLKTMSIGSMIDPEAPMIWRGPMVMGAFEQMLRDVSWGELDVLVIDMPPGTGDVQLTLAQRVPVTGAVIVSTPQDLALLDVKRGISMFHKVNVPLIGMIENMSYFICGTCNTVHHPFGQHGAKLVAETRDVPFLGAIPLVLELREAGDSGKPFMAYAEDHPVAQEIEKIAAKVWDSVEALQQEHSTLSQD